MLRKEPRSARTRASYHPASCSPKSRRQRQQGTGQAGAPARPLPQPPRPGSAPSPAPLVWAARRAGQEPREAQGPRPAQVPVPVPVKRPIKPSRSGTQPAAPARPGAACRPSQSRARPALHGTCWAATTAITPSCLTHAKHRPEDAPRRTAMQVCSGRVGRRVRMRGCARRCTCVRVSDTRPGREYAVHLREQCLRCSEGAWGGHASASNPPG